MAKTVVQMDYGVMTDVSNGFHTAGDVLNGIGSALTALVTALRLAAFFSMGTSAALAEYLDNIKNKVNNLAKVCGEFSSKLKQAVQDHRNGDVEGKHYFGEGVKGG